MTIAAMLSNVPVGLWALSAVLYGVVATEHGLVKTLAAASLAWCGYLLMWHFTPQLGPWEASALYFALSVPTALNSLILKVGRS